MRMIRLSPTYPQGWVGLASLLMGAILLLPQRATAQLTLAGDTVVTSPVDTTYLGGAALRLTPGRVVVAGAVESLGGGRYYRGAIFFITSPNGRLLRRRILSLPGNPEASFRGIISSRHGFASFFDNPSARPGQYPSQTWIRFDTLGNTTWQRALPVDSMASWRRASGFPGGVLTSGGGAAIGPGGFKAEFRRWTPDGDLIWKRQFGYWSYGRFLAPLLDGSYAAHTIDPTQYGIISYNNYRYDHRLYKLTAGGDSLTSSWVGTPNTWEGANEVKPTTDGGLIICGFEAPAPYSTVRRGVLIKVDSLLQEQWRYRIYGTCCDAEYGAEVYNAWELADGHYMILASGDNLPGIREIIPPAATGQLPTVGWTWQFPFRQNGPNTAKGFSQLLYEGTTGYGFGQYFADVTQTYAIADFYQCRLTNLPAPAVLDYCRRPPRLDSLRWAEIDNRPDSLRFWLEARETHPGPRYAELSLIEWDFGDGQTAEGWDVTHAYASPTPVRVRVCATNNVGCKVCRERFPYGPLSVRQEKEALVSVFPNPAPDGRFRLRGATGATATVLDAVGRVVLTQPGAEEGVVDLSSQPGGVYVLRLTWPEGTTLVRRLVR